MYHRSVPGNHVVCKHRVKDALPVIVQLSKRWPETWVYADPESIIVCQHEVRSMAHLFAIRLDGTLPYRKALRLLADELDLEVQA